VDFKLMNRIGHRPWLSNLSSRPAGDARGAHHVDDAGGKAEQEKHDHPPWRDSEPTVERPADERADQDTGNKLGGEAEAAGKRRRIASRPSRFDFAVRLLMLGEPIAETLEPRGESSLFGRPVTVSALLAGVFGHARRPCLRHCDREQTQVVPAVPKSRADHRVWGWVSQEMCRICTMIQMIAIPGLSTVSWQLQSGLLALRRGRPRC